MMGTESKSWLDATPSKTAFAFGLVLGIGISALAGFVLMLSFFLTGGPKLAAAPSAPSAVVDPGTNPDPNVPTGPVDIQLTDSDKNFTTGPAKAKVTVVEYSDFQCPFCSRFAPSIQQMLTEYKDKVKFVYRHFPLDAIHPNARPAAIAATCAAEQGKFFEYHDQLFAKQDQLGDALYKQLAKDLKLNTAKFESCLTSAAAKAKVDADYQSGITAGVQGTPATFVNGNLVSGAQPYEALKAVIDSELGG